MHPFSVIFTVLSIFVFSVLGAPLPIDQSLDKRTTTGRGTWYYDGLGACGNTNSNGQSVIALSRLIFEQSYCGRWISVTNTATGQTAVGQVEDECQSCGEGDLDMSEGLFGQIGQLATGVLTIDWYFEPSGWEP